MSSIPNQVPYFQVPPEARDKALRRSWPPKGLRVGLVWAGDPTNERDHFRSIALSALASILALEGIHFFSLQVGTASKQIGEAETRITDLSPEFTDMADTAAHIEHLDLVISVDTSVAHLAGALGKPVWILLSTVADVRWFLEREDSPWYPTARLFRQKKFMDWSEVMERVVSALHELASNE
jgi:ADP-heptose:LPS heptosyltransferase